MLFQGHFAFVHKSGADVRAGFAYSLPFKVGFCLGETQAKDNNKNGRACAKPEQWSPAMRRSVNQTSSKCSSKKVAKRVTLLQHSGYDPTRCFRTVFQSRSSSVSV
jgi:hypothetical protein